jgi:hypothetical protein
MKTKRILIPLTVFLIVLFSGCSKDYLDTISSDIVTEEQLRELGESSPDAIVKIVEPLVEGFYTFMIQYNTQGSTGAVHDDFGQKAIDQIMEIMGEDVILYTAGYGWFNWDYILDYRLQQWRRTFQLWFYYYKLINNANAVLEKIDPETVIPELRYLAGQAFAVRGMSYHYLIQLYQHTYNGHENAPGVPVYTESEVLLARQPVGDVYNQIIADLEKAYEMLDGFEPNGKTKITKRVTAGLLARAYLSMENWEQAAFYANTARQGMSPMTAVQYNEGFNSISNPEWIWGAEITPENTTMFASWYAHMDPYSPGYAGAIGMFRLIDQRLYNSFPASDARKLAFNDPANFNYDSQFPDLTSWKWRDKGNWVSDVHFMRAAEMYLIESEALSYTNPGQAQQVLYDLIVTRDPGYVKPSTTGEELREEIIRQKRFELWCEGQNWLDIKRLKKGIVRTGSNHRSDAEINLQPEADDFVFQIPLREIEMNSMINDADQNP